jgi:hypothetical protein
MVAVASLFFVWSALVLLGYGRQANLTTLLLTAISDIRHWWNGNCAERVSVALIWDPRHNDVLSEIVDALVAGSTCAVPLLLGNGMLPVTSVAFHIIVFAMQVTSNYLETLKVSKPFHTKCALSLRPCYVIVSDSCNIELVMPSALFLS